MSAQNERVEDALERAAEMVAVCEPMYIAGFPHGDEAVTQVMPDALAGGADAVKALNYVRCICLESKQTVERLGHDYDCPKPDADKAIAKFCDAMLGGSDEQH